MLEDVRLLLELQDIDYWIGELERSKEYIPDMMNNLKKEMEEVAEQLKDSREKLKESRIESQNLELKAAEAKEQLEKYQEQMLTIKTNKEYDALVNQIETIKADIAADEERYLILLDDIDELEKSIGELEIKDKGIQKENQERLGSLQHEIDSVADKMEKKVAHRQTLKAKVPRQVMSIYQRVRKGRGGDVVVQLKRGACGACYKSQTPQKIQEIKKGDKLQICDSCGRILMWDGDN
ncbi:MAG: hypothetical protein KAT58_04760 [candidate division Zixibacteria bacterium]|nr:hypothetical protein [candidate division Zixibacteria bacterium]